MNETGLTPELERVRRIIELKHAADMQRDLLLSQMQELSDHLRPLEVARHAATGLVRGAAFVGRLLGRGNSVPGVILEGLGLETLADASIGLGRWRFPWKAAVGAGLGAMELVRWVKGKRKKEGRRWKLGGGS